MRCENCEHKNTCLDKELFNLGGCSSGVPSMHLKTNGDKIRSMSDEELATFITGIVNGYDVHAGNYIDLGSGNVIFSTKDTDAESKLVEWLNTEVES